MGRLPAILAWLGLTLGPPRVAAQWSVSVDVGVARFGGTSRDSAGATVGPYRPTTFGLRLERGSGEIQLDFCVSSQAGKSSSREVGGMLPDQKR